MAKNSMIRSVVFLSFFALSFFFVMAPTIAKEALAPAAQFIQSMGDKALLTLTDKEAARTAREERARDILRTDFDIPAIARFALGTYWRQATDAEKTEYLGLFEDMIVQTYTTRFEDYSGQIFKVEDVVDTGGRDTLVNSSILQKDGPPVSVQWRVRTKEGGQMKVVDVVIERISMSVTQRSDFSSVIQGGGGRVATLIESMRARHAPAR